MRTHLHPHPHPYPYPQAARARTGRRRARRGLGMVELLAALAISAGLLVATAIAVDAAFRSYKVNQEQSQLLQRARVAQNYLSTSVRTTDQHAPYTGSAKTQFLAGTTVTDTGLQMYDVNDNLVTIRYDSANKRVLVIQGAVSNVLASGVEQFQVKLEPMRSATSIRTGGGYDLLKRATFLLTVKTNAATSVPGEAAGKQTISLSASVMPRRNAW